MSPTDLKYQKMAAEEKDIRALLRRDFSASRMSATKWREAVETLRDLPLRYTVKFVDVDQPLGGDCRRPLINISTADGGRC